jgi:non-specific serine/threonine protein kinase
LRDALEERFALLTAGRRDAAVKHRTLQAALDWSHGLLAPAEQRLFRVCGVFSGGFTLELLVHVAGEPAVGKNAAPSENRWTVIDSLAQLVDSSLVSTDVGEPPRFALLETMRDYARQRLAAGGEENHHRSRHAHAMAELAERADTADDAARALMLAEHDNLREAIAWLLANEPARAVEMAIRIGRVASFSAWRHEAQRWLESCEIVVEAGVMSPLLRAQWWRERARQMLMNRDPRARAMSLRALELHRGLGDDPGEFQALGCIVRASVEASDDLEDFCAEMRALLARHPEWPIRSSVSLAGVEALACGLRDDHEGELRHRLAEHDLASRDGWQAMADAADTNVVAALAKLGRHDEALARSRTILERLRDSDSGNAAYAWHGHVGALLALGRFDEFRAAARSAAGILRKNGLPLLTDQYAVLLAEEGRADDAARMIGHARNAYRACGMAIERRQRANLDHAERIARATLDEPFFDRRVEEGSRLDDAAADRLVLGPPEELGSSRQASCG